MTSSFNRFFSLPAVCVCALSSSFVSGCNTDVEDTVGGQTLPRSPDADAAWSVTLVDNAADCAAQGGTDMLGEVSASIITTRMLNGSHGAAVNCAITPVGSAGAFSVEASASMGGDSLFIRIPSITAAATQASPVSGAITYSSTQVGSPFDDGTPSFYFSDPVEGVAPGKIWVTFTACCLESPSTASVCDVSPSYALFENCLAM
jgi:hypothetical protein